MSCTASSVLRRRRIVGTVQGARSRTRRPWRAGPPAGSTCSHAVPTTSCGTSGGRTALVGLGTTRWRAGVRSGRGGVVRRSPGRGRQGHRPPAVAQVVPGRMVGLGAPGRHDRRRPAVASWSAGRLDVFVRGTDHQLWHKWWANGWSGWEPLGAVLASAPAAVASSAGRLDVFVRGTGPSPVAPVVPGWVVGLGTAERHDRRRSRRRRAGPPDASTSSSAVPTTGCGTSGGPTAGPRWEPLGGVLASGPAAAAWSAGRLDVFVRGTDNQLWHKWYDGSWN